VKNLVNNTAAFEEVFEVLGGLLDGGLFGRRLSLQSCAERLQLATGSLIN